MANEAVHDATATEALMDDEVVNPDVLAATGGRKHIYITLVADGVDIDAGVIYDMLNVQFAVVQTEKDQLSHDNFIFNIGPA